MKINIKNKTVELKYGFRAMLIYEQIQGKSFEPKTIGDVVVFFYSIVLGSTKDFSLTYDDFLDWLDDNPSAVTDFSLWMQSIADTNSLLRQNNKTDNSEGESDPNV